jgi:hypothetical protein
MNTNCRVVEASEVDATQVPCARLAFGTPARSSIVIKSTEGFLSSERERFSLLALIGQLCGQSWRRKLRREAGCPYGS